MEGGADSWAAALANAKRAQVASLAVRVSFEGALSADAVQLQLAAATFADAGAGMIMLRDTGGDADEDALEAAVEAVLWVDVAGETMNSRLGLRCLNPDILALAASRFKVDVFDSCALEGGPAPLASTLLRALEGAGRKTGRDVVAVAAAEAELAAKVGTLKVH
jgi:hypothetical protein